MENVPVSQLQSRPVKIIILGAGQVGRTAAYHLAREEDNDVTVVDVDDEVLRDLQDGQGIGVKNVPAFVLFQDETPFVLVGARPLESFARLLQQQLRQVKVGP